MAVARPPRLQAPSRQTTALPLPMTPPLPQQEQQVFAWLALLQEEQTVSSDSSTCLNCVLKCRVCANRPLHCLHDAMLF